MATKHTPGPWRKGEKDTVWSAVRILSPSGMLVAKAHGATGPWKVAVANAKLIANAPDLADQLEEAVSILRALRNGTAPPVAPLDCIDTSVAILRAAGRL